MTEQHAAETLKATKGFDVSDNSIPGPAGEPQPIQPPAAPPASPPQAYSAGVPGQAYPGAAPAYPPAQPPYGAPAAPQPYAAPAAPPAYGAPAPQQQYYASVPPTQPAPGYPYGAQGYAAPRPNSGLALTSLICGIGGLVLFWLWAPVVASIIAVITGHMALKQIKGNPALGGRGMAIAGLITGYAGIGLLVAQIAIVLFAFLFFGAFSLPFLVNS